MYGNEETVYLDFGNGSEIQGPYTVESSTFNKLTRVYMYSFKEVGMCCGEMYLKSHPDDRKLTLGDVMYPPSEGQLNVLEAYTNHGEFRAESHRRGNVMNMLFFRPYDNMIKWLVEYANGRVIIDVGSGTGWLLQQLRKAGAKVVGIEPFLQAEDLINFNVENLKYGLGIINVMPRRVEECGDILKALGGKAMLLFARPCHSDFVENALDIKHPDTEALYITVPENLVKYRDLGDWDDKKVLIQHEGGSADKEVVYSIK
jgi:SAM-dependent methyltransferase